MKMLVAVAAVIGVLFVGVIATALYLIATPEPPISEPKDVFDFTSLRKAPTEIDPPSLRRFPARDGEQLAYRVYDSTAARILITRLTFRAICCWRPSSRARRRSGAAPPAVGPFCIGNAFTGCWH